MRFLRIENVSAQQGYRKKLNNSASNNFGGSLKQTNADKLFEAGEYDSLSGEKLQKSDGKSVFNYLLHFAK